MYRPKKFFLYAFMMMSPLLAARAAPAAVLITSTGAYPATTGSAANTTGILREGWVGTTDNYAGTLGTDFKVSARPLTVTALGYYDGPNSAAANITGYTADGLNHAHQVGIWDATGALIASVTVPAGTAGTAIADFRYANLGSPIILAANTYYVIGGNVTTIDRTGGAGVGDTFRNDSGSGTYSTDVSQINISRSYLNDGFLGAFAEPDTFGGGYFGANMIYTVPEPVSASWLGLGAMVLLRRARKN
jgi:hypothetical protein